MPATANAVDPKMFENLPTTSSNFCRHPVWYALTKARHSMTFLSQHEAGVRGTHCVDESKPQHWNFEILNK